MSVLLWIWCFPQMLVGLLVKLFTKAEKCGDHYNYKNKRGSVSLGEYIFLCPAHRDDPVVLRHELGHRTQSRMLGWLYLLVIGLPSLIWCEGFRGYRQKHHVRYHSFYTERWADKIGGIKRD